MKYVLGLKSDLMVGNILNKKSVVAVFTSNKIERGMTIEIWPLRSNLFEFPSNEWDMT